MLYVHSSTRNVAQLFPGPRILVTHLVRFASWGESRSGEKMKGRAVIPFNEELNLSPYTRENFALQYRLLSVVQHRGTRAYWSLYDHS